ncbi:MAG: YtxH domain-containing protein [Candidatus Levybacteria bacterium]|nr:YtxH domain-containing protein [Candidatus Levybacteria bacterium]
MGSNNRFIDGLLIGALIGGAGVFLFTTERGKKILKLLTEEGAEGIEEILKAIESEQEEKLPKEVIPVVEDVEEKIEKKVEEIKENAVPSNGSPKKKSPRRFFRKSKS